MALAVQALRRCSFMAMLPHVVDRCIVSRAIPRIRLPRHPSHRIALGRPVGQLNGAKENSIHNFHTKHTTTPSTARTHTSLYLSHTVQARHLDQKLSRREHATHCLRPDLMARKSCMACKSLLSTSKCNMSSFFRVRGLMKSVTLDEEKSLCGRLKGFERSMRLPEETNSTRRRRRFCARGIARDGFYTTTRPFWTSRARFLTNRQF